MRDAPATGGGVPSPTLSRFLSVLAVVWLLAPFGGAAYSGAPTRHQASTRPPRLLAADEVKALRQKAEGGDAAAQASLGALYLTGQGVGRNATTAAKWYRKAAEQGLPLAQHNLGILCRDGNGTKRDVVEALKWLALATRRASTSEDERLFSAPLRRLGQTMKDNQIAEALARVSAWTNSGATHLRPAGQTDSAGLPAPRVPDASGVYRPGSGVTGPDLLREVRPQYTPDGMRAKIQGSVTLECVVQRNGTVDRCSVVRSLDPTFGLDQEALKAARQWRFVPGSVRGEPVPVRVMIELTFTLR